MTEENKTSDEATDAAETAESGSEETKTPGKKAAPTSILTRDSDKAPRPGFRAPANKGTKANKKKKTRKKR
jgi:hypothetical protein